MDDGDDKAVGVTKEGKKEKKKSGLKNNSGNNNGKKREETYNVSYSCNNNTSGNCWILIKSP